MKESYEINVNFYSDRVNGVLISILSENRKVEIIICLMFSFVCFFGVERNKF